MEKKDYITQLTIRYIKEINLYNNFIMKMTTDNKTLKNIMCCRNINDIFRLMEKYAIKYYTGIFIEGDYHSKILYFRNDFENYVYENLFNKNKIQLFHQFLDKNKIRKVFYNNLKRNEKTYSPNMNGYYSELHMLINDAFDWEKSIEGFDFWSKMSSKLQDYRRELLSDYFYNTK